MTFQELCSSLEEKIKQSYEEGVTTEMAERLAGEFLYAQLRVSAELKTADLDSRMQKSGLKAIRATVYMEAAAKGDKKPTETAIQSIIDTDKTVANNQDSLDAAEVSRDDLKRYYDIFQNAHVHFRTIAKGTFGG